MLHTNSSLVSRAISALLLALLTAFGLYVCTLGWHWPSDETSPVWLPEMLYALGAGALRFALWPLWPRKPAATPRDSLLSR